MLQKVWGHLASHSSHISHAKIRTCSTARRAELHTVKCLTTYSPFFFSKKGRVSHFLIARPMAGHWRQASGSLFVGLAGAVAVGWWMSNTWAAGWRGRTGRGLGFDLQPLVSQGLCKVVVHRHADGQLLGASFLVVHAEASLEMLFHDVVVVAFGNHCCEKRWIRSIRQHALVSQWKCADA